MTFENALKKIKTEFAKADASKLADMAVQVTMTDEDCGGTFYFKASNGESGLNVYKEQTDFDYDSLEDIMQKKYDN